jgi:hypothetical protein
MKTITKPVLGVVIEIRVLKQTSAIYFCSIYSLIALLASLSYPKPVRISYKTGIIKILFLHTRIRFKMKFMTKCMCFCKMLVNRIEIIL